MKKVLFVPALSSELKEVKNKIKNLNFKGINISYFVSGMGNYNTIFNLTKFLEQNNDIDFIVNIGVCGFKDYKEDFIQIGRIKNICNNKELIIPNFIDFGKVESIACSEKIIYNGSEIGEENFVDMESFGFEMVCDKFDIPRIILKVPVDKIGEETKNFDFKKAKRFLSENIDYEKLIKKISNFLEKNKKEEINLEKYFKILNFSESQKIIFKKLYNKYLVLVGDDFDEYFDNFLLKFVDKNLEKKDLKIFLKDLELFLEDE